MSGVAKMTERTRAELWDAGEIMIDDPKNYTRPFTINLTQNTEVDTELVDEFCLQNEKSYQRMQNGRWK
jgi:hypothetical protein